MMPFSHPAVCNRSKRVTLLRTTPGVSSFHSRRWMLSRYTAEIQAIVPLATPAD